MKPGKMIFAQVMEHLPHHVFQESVKRYAGRHLPLSFSHWDQFLCMAFAQLVGVESLRGIETCLRAHQSKLYHLGIKGHVSKSTLADANEGRDWRIWRDIALELIGMVRPMYAGDAFAAELDSTVCALDTTTIDLCLSVFPWAKFRRTKAAVKMHTLLDLRGNIPTFMHISDGKMHEVNVLDMLAIEPGSFYIMDRGFNDFSRLHGMHQAGAFFVIRAKTNTQLARKQSYSVDKTTVLRSDQRVRFAGKKTAADYPDDLRRVTFYDTERSKHLVFLTNNFTLPALTIAKLYKQRWQVELFFKWIKQHLHIKAFFGTTENAVKTQIWIAMITYLLVAIIKKRAASTASLYDILQILSISPFEKIRRWD
ncbi:MAG: IS4 family transposase [Holosporales bacterium]|jgi:hypothetical protein